MVSLIVWMNRRPLACRTGVIFCVFQANRGENEASAWRARVACEGRIAKKNPPVPIPLFKPFRRSNMNAAT